ncbi:GntR family transcriptional regulator [Vagococcus vulneris]|uniref:GntR family transcriptional regulator n=1 Tax=Vagococcus vulneris TaxID=1977869 RepID=UPI001402733A|nr:GntR family transcriptional regulator [Vagococcus vulneris]
MKSKRIQKIAYDYIKSNVESGVWRDDVKLVEQDISDTLSVSRTPVREAINELVTEGYLHKEPNKGVVVCKTKISAKEFLERTQLLELLFSSYLFQLEVKKINLDSIVNYDLLRRIDDERRVEDKKLASQVFLESFLSELDNRVMRQVIMNNFRQLYLTFFPTADNNFLYDEMSRSFSLLITHLDEKRFDLCRKDIRIFFNRLNLELIDQQI